MNLAVAAVVKSITWADQLPQSLKIDIQQKTKIDISVWRNKFTLLQAKQDSVTNKNNDRFFTMADLCSGGCLDTIAAMRVGF